MNAPGTGRRLASRERTMLIALGVVALLAVAFLFLAGGDDEPITVDDTPRPPRTEAPDTGTDRPPLTDQRFEGRDPFVPLVTGGTGGTGNGGSGNGGTDNGGAGNGNGDTGHIDGGGEVRTVTLLDIFTSDGERFATVEVDSMQYTVAEGETFADNFRLLELTRRCGTFVFGDERFTLCIGDEVQK